jgi:hypothetical protein
LYLKPLFVFKEGGENPFSIAEFVKKIAKNNAKWRKYAKVR